MTRYADEFAKLSGSTTANTSNPVDLTGLDSELRTRLEKLQEIYKKETGKDLPVTSGVRTAAQERDLFQRAQRGEKGIYTPLNPDEVKKDLYHTDAVDISKDVPQKYLDMVGLHRPLGEKDPVHVMINPKADYKPEPSTKYAKDFSAFQQTAPEVKKEAPKENSPSRLEAFAAGAGHGFGSLVLGGEQLLGKGLKAVGLEKPGEMLAADALAGIKKTNEEIAKYEKTRPNVTGAGKMAGEIAGLIPTGVGAMEEGAPLMRNLYQAAKGGAFAGLLQPVTNQEDYATEKAKQIAGGAVGGVAGYPIGAGIGKAVGYGANVGMDLAKQFNNKLQGKGIDKVVADAAAKVNLPPEAHIDIQSASPAVQKEFVNNINKGAEINPVAIKNIAAADRLGIQLLPGMANRDAGIWSNEQNARGENSPIRGQISNINKGLVKALEDLHADVSGPHGKISNEYNLSSKHIELIGEQVKNNRKEISQAYDDLEKLNGGKLPVDGKQWADNVIAKLNEEDRLDHLKEHSPVIYRKLMEYQKGDKEMNMNLFKNLASDIAEAQRGADGTTKHVLGVARSELENLPMDVQNEPVRQARDKAVSLAKAEFAREDAIPAYNAVAAKIAKGKGAAEPEDFVRKHIIGGSAEEIGQLINEIKDPTYKDLVAASLTNRIKEKAITVGNDDIAHRTLDNHLNDPYIQPKLDLVLNPQQKQKLSDIYLTSLNAKVGPTGEFKNYSNTDVANAARQGTGYLGKAVDYLTASPVGSIISNVAAPAIGNKVESYSIGEMLKPGAGMAKPYTSPLTSTLTNIGTFGGALGASDYVSPNTIQDLANQGQQ